METILVFQLSAHHLKQDIFLCTNKIVLYFKNHVQVPITPTCILDDPLGIASYKDSTKFLYRSFSRNAYFLPFFFVLPSGPPPSTKIPSSSLPAFPVADLAGVVGAWSNSFINSDLIVARFFSHHSFSVACWASISSNRFRSWVFAAISFADWKMV